MRVLQYFTRVSSTATDPPWTRAHLNDTESSLSDILTRPCFTRIWTVQETTLAQHLTFLCGTHQLSWHGDLRTLRALVFRVKSAAISPYFTSSLGNSSTLDWSPLLEIIETQMRQAAKREGVVLRRNQLDLAYEFRHRRSTDPRDKYYAIFNILENESGGRLSITPDYTVALEELHEKFTSEIRRLSEIEDGGFVEGWG